MQGVQQTDIVSSTAFTQSENNNVYLSYLQKNQPTGIPSRGAANNSTNKVRPSVGGQLNSDLVDLTGFGLVQSMGEDSNTFVSQQQEQIVFVMADNEDNLADHQEDKDDDDSQKEANEMNE